MSDKFYKQTVEILDMHLDLAETTLAYLEDTPYVQGDVYRAADDISMSNSYCKDEKQFISEKKLVLKELNKRISDVVACYWVDENKVSQCENCTCGKNKCVR